MSAQSTLVNAGVSGQAALVPNYGGAGSGGAGAACGGRAQAMDVSSGSGLPNGVRVDGSPFEADRQLPHNPAGRIDSGVVVGAAGQAERQTTAGIVPRENTGPGANVAPEGRATSRGFQGNGQQQPAAPQQPQADRPRQQAEQQQPAGQQHSQVQQPPQDDRLPQPAEQQQLQMQGQPQTQQQPQVDLSQQPPVQQQSPGDREPGLRSVQPQTSTHTSQRTPVVMDVTQAQGTPRAVAQLNEQRSALIAALHQRAARMLHTTADGMSTTVAVNEGGYGEYTGEQVVWYSRLGSFFQRTMGPMMERLRAPPATTTNARPPPSPTLPLSSSPLELPAQEPLRKQVIQEWNHMNPAPQRLERQGDQSSNGSIPAEVVQEEVKRQVQIAMQTRDERNQALQAENLELKHLLMEMMEVGPSQQGAHGGEVPPVESGGPIRSLEAGVGPSAGYVQPSERGELLGGQCDRDLPPLPVPSRSGVGAPPGLEGSNLRLEGGNKPPLSNLGGGGMNEATGKPPSDRGSTFASRSEVLPGGGRGTAGPHGDKGAVNHEETDPMGLLAKGIQQLQQLHLRRDGPEPELLKGSLELPKLPEPYQDASSVAFLEWIYETGQVVGSITDKASSWWTSTLDAVMEAYHRYQMETPLRRLEVRPGPTPGVDVERWARLDKRVLALLMPAMTATIKQEILMLRLGTVKEVLFKLYTVYAPGGAAERASLLRQLETIPTTTSVVDLIANLRRWKKLASRAAEMGVALPDGSVLLMAIEAAVKGVVDSNRDMAFKLNMAKQELQLPYKPVLSAVMIYADHVMAELHQIIPYTNKEPRLKGMQTGPSTPTSSTASPKGKGAGQPQPCKFWLSEMGAAEVPLASTPTSSQPRRTRRPGAGPADRRLTGKVSAPLSRTTTRRGTKGELDHQRERPRPQPLLHLRWRLWEQPLHQQPL